MVRVNLDGSGSKVIQAGMDNPNGVVASSSDKVFVVDSHYKSRKQANVNYPGEARNGSLYVFKGSDYEPSTVNTQGDSMLIVSKTYYRGRLGVCSFTFFFFLFFFFLSFSNVYTYALTIY